MISDKMPVYLKVYNVLKSEIQNYRSVGELLPPEPALEKKYGVSRITIRKAIQLLSEEGYVSVKQGYGTTVTRPKAVHRMNYIYSVTETLRRSGYKVHSQNIYIDLCVPNEDILKLLDAPANTKFTRMQRILIANHQPISIVTNYITPELVPDLQDNIENFDSLYSLLETKYHIKFDYATDYITARSANFLQAQVLQIPNKSPLISIRRVIYIKDRPVMLDDLLIESSRYQFSVNLSCRPPKE
jgi:GntR family transcriptional regulator